MPDSTAVIQVAFEVPQEIATGLSTGELVRYGGVVRDTGGRVVKHLDEITPKPSDDAANAIQQAASNAMNFVKKNKKGTIIVLAVAAIGGIAYKTVKGSQKKALEKLQVEASERFNASLTAYIKALENENLTLTDIEGLQRAIADFEDVAGDGGLTIEMPGGSSLPLSKRWPSIHRRLLGQTIMSRIKRPPLSRTIVLLRFRFSTIACPSRETSSMRLHRF